MDSVSRDRDITYDSIVDNKGKILTNFNVFNKDFVTNLDENEKKLGINKNTTKQFNTMS